MSLCQSPAYIKQMLMPCGQCMACRLRKKREWTHRIMLEAVLHKHNSFVTLTYRTEDLPDDASLNPEHLRLFWMRLRKEQAKYGRRLRYYACGEYGDDYLRPHYHAAIFGMPSCKFGRTRHYQIRSGFKCCDNCDAFQRAWPHGRVDVGALERASAAYICGYVTKKLSDRDDARYGGRYPEFARMSKMPGLGARYIPEVASKLLELPSAVLREMPDVPNALRHGGKPWPLGRYLVRLLRAQIGRSKDAPEGALAIKREEVQKLRSFAETFQGGLSFSQVYKSIALEINNPAFEKLMNKQQYNKGHRSYEKA